MRHSEPPPGVGVCSTDGCSELFTRDAEWARRYCSDKCRQKAWRDRDRAQRQDVEVLRAAAGVEWLARLAGLRQEIQDLHRRLGPQLNDSSERQKTLDSNEFRERFEADQRNFHMLVGRLLSRLESGQ